MDARKLSLGLGVLVALGAGTTALAGGGNLRLGADPFNHDPFRLRNTRARWVRNQGLPDTGNRNYALLLEKRTFTPQPCAAGATITGANGLTVEGDSGYDFGFDIREDSHATAGSPRFNLVASDGFHFIGGAGNGDVIDSSQDSEGRTWFRVRFDAQDFTQAYPPVEPGATIHYLALVADEGIPDGSGEYWLDNLMVDPLESGPVIIGKPGKNQEGDIP